MCLVQLPNGQPSAVIAACLVASASLVLLAVARRRLSKQAMACLFLWLCAVAYLLRPNYLADIETRIEAFWLIVGSVMLLTAAANAGAADTSPSVLYEPAFLGASLVLVSMVTGSTLGGLVRVPYAGTRYVGGFDGPNEMGAFYVLALTLMVGEHISRRRVRLVWVKTAVFLVAAISSWSRGAMVALAFIYVLSFSWGYARTRGGRRLGVITAFLLLTAAIAYLYVTAFLPQYGMIRPGAGERGYLLETTLGIVRQGPVFGHGLGSYWFLGDSVNATPHSEYLLFLVSGGVIGLALLVGLYGYWLKTALQKRLYSEAMALTVFYLLELFFNNLVRGRVSFFFWGLVFLVLTGQRRGLAETKSASAEGQQAASQTRVHPVAGRSA